MPASAIELQARRFPLTLAIAIALAVAAALAMAVWLADRRDLAVIDAPVATAGDDPLLLFSSLPIYWGEAPDFDAMLSGKAKRHWARAAIEKRRRLMPLDTLELETLGGAAAELLMVQPRPLSPQENVALDDWVTKGGRVLLFADPALTEDSVYPVGDRRRPQDIVMLSPILGRWGLALQFDEDQDLGERGIAVRSGHNVPVNLPGRFAAAPSGRPDAACAIGAEALIAECRIGRGKVVAVADAAVFDRAASGSALAARKAALEALLDRTFAR